MAGRRRALAAVAALALAGSLTACTGDDAAGGDATAGSQAAPSTTTTAPQSQLDTPGATTDPDGVDLEAHPLQTSTIPRSTDPGSTPSDPAIAIGPPPGSDGYRPLRLDPTYFAVVGELVPNAGNPYHEIMSEGASFSLVLELYPDAGAGWDGSPGAWPTDCALAGICVYFDRDGSGDEPTLVAAGDGTARIDRIADGDYVVTLTGVRFPADGGGGYRLADLTLDVRPDPSATTAAPSPPTT